MDIWDVKWCKEIKSEKLGIFLQRQKSLVWAGAEDLNTQGAVVSPEEEEDVCMYVCMYVCVRAYVCICRYVCSHMSVCLSVGLHMWCKDRDVPVHAMMIYKAMEV